MTKEELQKKIGHLKSFDLLILENNHVSLYVGLRMINCSFRDGHLFHHVYFDNVFSYATIVDAGAKLNNTDCAISLGSDPELFFVKDGVMIPSTAVIKTETDRVARDGFQLELHPASSSCRQIAGNQLRFGIGEAGQMAAAMGAKISFSLSHIVDTLVWKTSPKELKQFGCHPTENVHEKAPHRSSGLRERFRAGGGHIHVGNLTLNEKKTSSLVTLVKVMDIIVGNTLVLLDRDPANITRRKNYGRAGEYRPKPYGLEYRVPSNFWLKHYVLWSLASGLIRNAVTLYRNGRADKLFKLFKMSDIKRAINTNDFGKAMANFMVYKRFLEEENIYFTVGVSKHNVEKFLSWVLSTSPLNVLDIENDDKIYTKWLGLSAGSADGFESFLRKLKL